MKSKNSTQQKQKLNQRVSVLPKEHILALLQSSTDKQAKACAQTTLAIYLHEPKRVMLPSLCHYLPKWNAMPKRLWIMARSENEGRKKAKAN